MPTQEEHEAAGRLTNPNAGGDCPAATCSEDLLRGAGYVLQEAVEKLLALPEMHPDATEEELEEAVENGFAPEIREHAETVLLARNALRITGSIFPQNVQADEPQTNPRNHE